MVGQGLDLLMTVLMKLPRHADLCILPHEFVQLQTFDDAWLQAAAHTD